MQHRILYTHISLIAQFRIFSLFGNLADLLCLWTALYESFNCLVSILFRFPSNILFLCLCEKFNLLECSGGSLITGQQRQDTDIAFDKIYTTSMQVIKCNEMYIAHPVLQLCWQMWWYSYTEGSNMILNEMCLTVFTVYIFWIVPDMKYACPATCNSDVTLRTPRPSPQAALSCHGSWVRHLQLLVWSGVVPHWGLALGGAGGAGGVQFHV